jgi:hypothetical protein
MSGIIPAAHWLHIKMQKLPSHKQLFLLFRSEHISSQIGHHQVMREECQHDGGICKKLQRSSNFEILLISPDST